MFIHITIIITHIISISMIIMHTIYNNNNNNTTTTTTTTNHNNDNNNNHNILTPGLHNKIPAHKIFARVWVAQESIVLHFQR